MDNTEPRNGMTGSGVRVFAFLCVLLTLVFGVWLYRWVRLAFEVNLHSHVVLIPVVSGYLVWLRRGSLPAVAGPSAGWGALCGVLSLGLVLVALSGVADLARQDQIALMVGAYVTGLLGLGFICLGGAIMRACAFPAFFLLFMIPMPSGLEVWAEQFLQALSADAAHVLFWISGETFLREGQVFVFPGQTIQVAQECSGIRSSLVLFILGMVAANQILSSPWRRVLVVFSVLPLGILRNAVRIYVITALTLHVDPEAIHSPLHHRGGPLFFAVSLVPFAAILWVLWKTEKRAGERRAKEITS